MHFYLFSVIHIFSDESIYRCSIRRSSSYILYEITKVSSYVLILKLRLQIGDFRSRTTPPSTFPQFYKMFVLIFVPHPPPFFSFTSSVVISTSGSARRDVATDGDKLRPPWNDKVMLIFLLWSKVFYFWNIFTTVFVLFEVNNAVLIILRG